MSNKEGHIAGKRSSKTDVNLINTKQEVGTIMTDFCD